MPVRRLPRTTPDWEAAARRRAWLWFVVSALLAVLFGLLAYQAWRGWLPQQEPRVPAVFAVQPLEAGTIITPKMVEVRQVPREVVPQGVFSGVEAVVGRQVVYPVVAGEMLTESKVTLGPGGGVLARKCPGATWCVSLPEAWFVAAPPQVAEGDRVDIIGVRPKAPYKESVFLADDVPVIGVGHDGKEGRRFVLAVDAQESLSLLYAHVNEYRLLLLLRSAQQAPSLPTESAP